MTTRAAEPPHTSLDTRWNDQFASEYKKLSGKEASAQQISDARASSETHGKLNIISAKVAASKLHKDMQRPAPLAKQNTPLQKSGTVISSAPAGSPEGRTGKLPDGSKVVIRGGKVVIQ